MKKPGCLSLMIVLLFSGTVLGACAGSDPPELIVGQRQVIAGELKDAGIRSFVVHQNADGSRTVVLFDGNEARLGSLSISTAIDSNNSLISFGFREHEFLIEANHAAAFVTYNGRKAEFSIDDNGILRGTPVADRLLEDANSLTDLAIAVAAAAGIELPSSRGLPTSHGTKDYSPGERAPQSEAVGGSPTNAAGCDAPCSCGDGWYCNANLTYVEYRYWKKTLLGYRCATGNFYGCGCGCVCQTCGSPDYCRC